MDGLAHCSKNRRKYLISFFFPKKNSTLFDLAIKSENTLSYFQDKSEFSRLKMVSKPRVFCLVETNGFLTQCATQ